MSLVNFGTVPVDAAKYLVSFMDTRTSLSFLLTAKQYYTDLTWWPEEQIASFLSSPSGRQSTGKVKAIFQAIHERAITLELPVTIQARYLPQLTELKKETEQLPISLALQCITKEDHKELSDHKNRFALTLVKFFECDTDISHISIEECSKLFNQCSQLERLYINNHDHANIDIFLTDFNQNTENILPFISIKNLILGNLHHGIDLEGLLPFFPNLEEVHLQNTQMGMVSAEHPQPYHSVTKLTVAINGKQEVDSDFIMMREELQNVFKFFPCLEDIVFYISKPLDQKDKGFEGVLPFTSVKKLRIKNAQAIHDDLQSFIALFPNVKELAVDGYEALMCSDGLWFVIKSNQEHSLKMLTILPMHLEVEKFADNCQVSMSGDDSWLDKV